MSNAFPKKAKFFLLLGLVLLNVAVRIPAEGQFREHLIDSFNLHALSDEVNEEHRAKWVVHPLSIFGLYPYSWPAIPVFLVSAISMLTGLGTEESVFVLSMAVGLAGIGAGYVLGGEFREDFRYRYLFATIVSLAPVFVQETVWTVPKRAIFCLEFVILLWLILRYRHRGHDKRYLLLMVPVLFSMPATHRLFLLMPLLLIGYAGLMAFFMLWRRAHVVIGSHTASTLLRWGAVSFWAASILGLLYLQSRRVLWYKDTDMWLYYSTGFFFNGTSPRVIFMNAIIDYWSSISLFAFVGILGLMTFVRRPLWDALLFIIALIGLFSTCIMLGQYVIYLFIPFFAVMSCEGVFEFFRLLPPLKRLLVPSLLVAVLLSAGFAGFMTQHWLRKGTTPGVTPLPCEDTYSAALYMRHMLPEGNALCNDFFIAKRVTAYGSVYCYPTYDALYLAFDVIDIDEVEVRPIELDELNPNVNTLYVKVDPPDNAIYRIPYVGLKNPREMETKERYDFHYAVINNNMPTRLKYWTTMHKSPLFEEIYNKRVTLFRNDLITIATLTERETFDRT